MTGNYSVGSSSTYLSNKTFTIGGRNEIFFNSKSGTSNLKINDATFSATGNLELTAYFADNDVFKVDGTGVNVSGSGNFIFVSTETSNINGIDFKSNTAYSNIRVAQNSEVTLYNIFTVGDGSQNLNGLTLNANSVIKGSTFKLGTNDQINIGGIDYSGDGSITFADDNENSVTLSGNVKVSLDKDESLTVNGTTYKATDDNADIIYNGSKITVDGNISTQSISGTTQRYELTGTSTTKTIDDIKFSAGSTDATVTVEKPAENSSDKTKISISGTVTVELTNNNLDITDYQFSLTQNSTAQIDGITFTKTGNTSKDNDIVFTAENEVTLNSAFTIGDGTKKLNGLIVTLETAETSTFNLGGDDDSVTVKNYSSLAESQDVTGNTDTISGITYTGNGNVNVSGNETDGYSVTLDGGISVTGDIPANTNFSLTGGNSYTFGKTTINPTNQTSISGISGTLSADTVLGNNISVGGLALGISDDSYTLNLDSSGNVESVAGSGTFTIGGKTFTASGNVTFALENNSVESITTTESNVTVSVDGSTAISLSSGEELTSYPNGSWDTTPPYDSYKISSGTVYGVFSGNPATETAITDSTTYSDYFTINNSTANITGNKSVEIEGAYTAVAGGKTYEIQSGSGTFGNSGISAVNGTIYRTIDSGNFTYNNGTYTIDTPPVKFQIDNSLAETFYSGTGHSDVAVGSSVTVDGTDITVSASAAQYTAVGNSGSPYTAFKGTGTYDIANASGNFTDSANKTYSISGNATYQLTATGEQPNGITTTLKNATGTRAFATGDSENKSYLGDEYTVTAGTYQLSISDGTASADAKSLTSGSATRTINSGSFNYIYNGSTRSYDATQNTSIEISFNGNDINVANKSGAGTRGKLDNETAINGGYTYDLGNDAKIQLTLSDGQETFYSGTATRTINNSSSDKTFKIGDNTYTAGSATLIWDKGNDSITLNSGSGTRADSVADFDYNTKNYTPSGNLTYIFDTNGERIYKASGTRSIDTNETLQSQKGNIYNLTEGTYQIDIDNGVTNAQETLTSAEGSKTFSQGTTFYLDKTYQAYTGGATLTFTLNGTTQTDALQSGSGIRSNRENFIYNDETYTPSADVTYILASGSAEKILNASGTRSIKSGDTYAINGGNTYDLTAGTYSISISDGATNAQDTLISATGSKTVNNNGSFYSNTKLYTADGPVTLGLSISDNGNTKTETFSSGKGTRSDNAANFTYNNQTYDTTTSGVTYILNSGETEKVLKATGTRTNVEGDTYTVGNHTYTLSAGTYSISVNNSSGTDNLISGTGSGTIADGVTFTDGKVYTAFGEVGLNLNVSNNGNTKTETFNSGKGTRIDSANTFTLNSKTYTKDADSNIVYQKTPNVAENLYSASGTRALASTDTFTASLDGNTYTATTGTYSISVSDNSGTEILSSGSGTYHLTNGSGNFVYQGKTYAAIADTTLTATLSNGNATALTGATGAGTREAEDADSAITYTRQADGNTYKTNTGSIVRADISGVNDYTQSFVSGTATQTYTANSGVFNYKSQNYTAQGNDATLTLTKDANGVESVTLTGQGTRTGEPKTFTIDSKVYTSAEDVVYQIATNDTAEKVYSAVATRTDIGDETIDGNWTNSYTNPTGTRTLTITDGAVTSNVITSASATKNLSNGNKFNYGNTEYTAQLYGATLSLSVTNDSPTETFDAGSGKSNTDYIIKDSSRAEINNITYNAEATTSGGIVTVTGDTTISNVSGGSIVGTIGNDKTVTIGNNTYTAKQYSTLQINGASNLTALGGKFEVTGLSAATTINGESITVSDSGAKVTFDNSGVTNIDNLSTGKSVSYSGSPTIKTKENGTFTIGNQSITIDGDSDAGATFTLTNGKVTEISGLERNATGDYVTVTVGSKSAKVKRSGDKVTIDDSGNLTVADLGIKSYYVTYDGAAFTVKAVDSNDNFVLLNTTDSDYTVSGKKLTIDTTKSIVVQNSSNESIQVNTVSGIKSTGNTAIEVESNGDFKIGSYDTDTKAFTEGITSGTSTNSTGGFKVGDGGKFTVDDSGKITVESTGTGTLAITVADISKANIAVKVDNTARTFKINNEPAFTITPISSNVEIGISVDSDTGEMSFDPNGACEIEVSAAGYSADLAGDNQILGQSADGTSFLAHTVKGLRIATSGDDDGSIKYVTDADGKLAGIKEVSEDATIILTGTMPSSFYVNDSTATFAVTSGTKIKKNAFTEKWTCGLADAADGNYKVEIDSTGTIKLFNSDKQTKNVNDYKAAFGTGTSFVPKNSLNNEEDYGTLPTYSSSITLTNRVEELKITSSGSDYKITNISADSDLTLNGTTTITPVTGGYKLAMNSTGSVTYNGVIYSGNNSTTDITIPSGGTGAITLADKTKVSGTVTDKSLTKSGDVIFDNADASGNGVKIGGTNALIVEGDGNFTVTSGNEIKGISGDATVKGDFAKSKTIVIDSAGTFQIGTKTYSILGDNDVTIKTGADGEVSEISGLGAQGSVTGDFANVKVNGKDIQVTGDTNIGVVGVTGDNAVSKIYGLTDGTTANVVKSGGATVLSTDGVGGQFTFGSKNYTLSTGTADFMSSGDTPTITEIKNIGANSTLMLGQGETNFTIGGNTVTNSDAATLHMGNNTIAGVENFTTGSFKGLSNGATVNVKTTGEITINDKAVQINDSDYYVYAKENDGYSTITSVAADSNIETAYQNAIIIPDAAGIFTFGATGSQHKFKTDSKPTFTMGDSNKVSAIGGVSGEIALYQDETGLKVLNDTITVKGAESTDAVTLVAGNGSVNQVKNLKGDVNGLNAGAVVQVTKGDSAIKFNSASDNLRISDTDYTVRATSDGYDLVTGLTSGAVVTTAKNASLVATITSGNTGEFTFGSNTSKQKFGIYGDDTVTFMTDANSKLTEIADVNDATISVYTNETGLKINGQEINVKGTDATPVQVKINGSGGISGFEGLQEASSYSLPAGATLKVNTTNNPDLTINNKALQIKDTSNITVRATNDGYDLVTGLSANATVTKAKDVTLVTDVEGKFNFNGHTLKTDDAQITLVTDNADNNNKVTLVSGVDVGKSLEFYQAESNFVLGVNTLTFGGASTSNTLRVTMGAGDTVSAVQNLKGGIKGLSAGANVEVATTSNITLNNDSKKLRISNANSNKVTVHTTADGYDSVVGLKNGASVSVAAADVTLTTGGTGTFGFVQNGAFTTGGDDTISFVTGSNSSIKSILDFDSNGTIGGDFSNAVTVNNKTVKVTDDTSISIVGGGLNNGITKIAGLTKKENGVVVVNNAGGAATISTDGNTGGKFQFGNDHSFSVSANTNFLATAITDYAPSITGVGDFKNDTLIVYQNEDSLLINDKTIKIGDVTAGDNVAISVDGSENIVGIGNLKGSVDSLPSNVTINVVDTEASINGEKWKIDEDSSSANYTVVTATNGGYSTVKGIDKNSVTFTDAKHSSIVATRNSGSTASTYTFNNNKFAVSGNDTEITLSTDANSKVTAIDDVKDATLAVYQNESFNINGRQINIGGLTDNAGSSDSDAVSLKFDASGNITEVGNLKGSIINLAENATIQVADSDVTINSVALKLNEAGGTSFNVISKATGYDTITGIDTDATVAQAANVSIVANISNMTSNAHKFYFGASATANMEIIGDSEVTIATDNNSDATAVGGFNGTLKSTADNLKINGVSIYNTDDNASIIAYAAEGVPHGISTIYGLADGKEVSVPAGTTVLYSVKSGEATKETKFTINGTAYNLLGDEDTISITDRTIKGLDADARLTISAVGSFNVNTKPLELTPEKNIVIGEGTISARLYNPDDIDFGANTPVDDVVEQIFGEGTTISAEPVATISVDSTEIKNRAVVISAEDDGKTVTLGGSALAIVQDGAENIQIYSTGTSNTVISSATDGVQVTGINDTDTRVMPTSSKPITYNSYDHSHKSGLQITNEDVIAAVHENLLKFNISDANITLPNNAVATMNYVANKVGIVNFYNLKGEMQKFGYTYNGNDTIDYSKGADHMLLRGHWKDSGVASTLLGGSGNDTAFGGTGDYIDLGRGKNYIEIGDGNATVAVSDNKGETTVTSFDNALNGDVVRVKFSETDAYYTNEGLIFVYGTSDAENATLTVKDVTAESDDTLYAYANALLEDSDNKETLVKTSIARTNGAIKVAANVTAADFTKSYVGHNSGVDFSEFNTHTININLSDGKGSLGTGDTITFRGITSLKGGNDFHTLIGSASDKNTLVSGKGAATIWGKGSSGDLLIGNTDTTKKDASTTFFYTTGDGKDTIDNFQFDTTEGEDSDTKNLTADKISLGADVSSVTHSGNDLVIILGEGDSLTVKDGVNKNFTTKNKDGKSSSVKTGSTLTYGGSDAYYCATATDSKLAISTVTVSTAIDLTDKSKYSDNITILDASGIAETISNKISLFGATDVNNTLIAAQNGSTLWGGQGTGNDSMVGGASADVFEYDPFDGNDTIQSYGADDIIFLYTAQLSTAKSFSTLAVDNGIQINTGNGSLTVIKASNYNDDITFMLADGTTRTLTSLDLKATEEPATPTTPVDNRSTKSGGYGNDTLEADSTGSILWGGDGGDDLLIGGDSSDVFKYDSWEGNDTIRGYGSGDIIYFYITQLSTAKTFSTVAVGNGIQINTGNGSLTIIDSSVSNITFKLADDNVYYGWNKLQAGDTTTGSADLAEDYWEVAQSNELLDGEVTFWAGESGDLATDYDNYLTDEICTGDIKFSIAPADTIYSFSDK